MKNSQSGNVLVYILIAVALLAALSFAITQSGRGNLGNLSAERAGLYATEIIEYGNIMLQATSQLRLRGYKDDEVSFENNVIPGYTNPNCTEDECKIFNLRGAGVHYVEPKSEWLDGAYSAQLRYGELYFHASSSAVDVGLNSDDLILFVPYVKKDLCMAINRKLGINLLNREVPMETHGPFDVNVKFTGSYGPAFDRKVSGDGTTGETDILYGKMAGCTEASGTSSTPGVGTYHYFQVLMAR